MTSEKRFLSPRSRQKAYALLGVDASSIKASTRLGISAEDLLDMQAKLAVAAMNRDRQQREKQEIRRASAKAAEMLGHDASREKVKHWLAIDDVILTQEEAERRRFQVEHTVNRPKLAKSSRELARAAPKARRVIDGEAAEMQREKLRDRFGVDNEEFFDPVEDGDEDGDGGLETKARSPALVTAPEKLKRLAGYDPHAEKLCRQLGLTSEQLEGVLIEALEEQARKTTDKEVRAAAQQRRHVQKALDRLGIDASDNKSRRLLGAGRTEDSPRKPCLEHVEWQWWAFALIGFVLTCGLHAGLLVLNNEH